MNGDKDSTPMDPRVQIHMEQYQQIRQIALSSSQTKTTPQNDKEQQEKDKTTTWPLSYMSPDNQRPSHLLLEDYSTSPHESSFVVSCRVTVLFLDPRLGDPHDFGVGHAAWFALESAAAFLTSNTTCFC